MSLVSGVKRDHVTDADYVYQTGAKNTLTLRQFRHLLGDRLSPVSALIGVSVAAGMCESALLALISQVAASLLTRSSSMAASVGPIRVAMPIGAFLTIGLVIAVMRIVLQVPIAYIPARTAARVRAKMQMDMFCAFTDASWSVQSQGRGGQFQELMTTQALEANLGVLQATGAVTAGFMLIVLVGSAFVIEPLLALGVVGGAVGLFAVLRPLNKVGSGHSRALSSSLLDYAGGIHEAVELAEEVQVFGTADAHKAKMGGLVEGVRRRFVSTQFVARLVPGLYQGSVLLLMVGGLGILYVTGSRHLASLGAIVLLLVRASTYGQQVQSAQHLLHQQLPFLDRIDQMQRRYRTARVSRGERSFCGLPSVSFERVTYSYGSRPPALEEISFEVNPGESVGIVGPSGAGKSTLVQLLVGLREPRSGRYNLAGHSAGSYSSSEWSRAIAYVPQESKLLHGSVAENISFSRDLKFSAIEEAAHLGRVDDDITSWADGYQTLIGQRANAVSGGQRQRICLARALASKPLVLVLDEPTSALDAESESLVQDSLRALRGRMTIFVVAHRLSALSVCDKVMVVVDGRLQSFGTKEDVADSDPYFRRVAAAWRRSLAVPP